MKPHHHPTRFYLAALLLLLLTGCHKSITSSNQSYPQNIPSVYMFTTSTNAVCDYDLDETSLTNIGWTKTFEDNFDTDLVKWNVWNSGAFNNELQHYQPQNLQLVDGKLQIVAKKETVVGITNPENSSLSKFEYTSGRIESKALISANTNTPRVRVAARIKLPAGYGMWPAFWSYGQPWPKQGEIDFMEARGQEPFSYITCYHYGKTVKKDLVKDATGFITSDLDLTACYHVFETEWTKDKLNYYLDGKLVEAKTSGGYIPSLFGKSQNIVLNLAVGGTFFATLDPALIVPGTMYVDWVKVFTSK